MMATKKIIILGASGGIATLVERNLIDNPQIELKIAAPEIWRKARSKSMPY